MSKQAAVAILVEEIETLARQAMEVAALQGYSSVRVIHQLDKATKSEQDLDQLAFHSFQISIKGIAEAKQLHSQRMTGTAGV